MKSKILVLIFLFLTISTSAIGSEQLIFVLDLVRHGDRTPFAIIPKAPYQWTPGFKQLTPEGMEQAFQFGVALRNKYINGLHLLPQKYLAQTLEVHSTDTDRTLMTAQSILLGLYPLGTGPNIGPVNQPALPAGFQPVPIHPMPAGLENLPSFSADPAKFNPMLETYVYSKPNWISRQRQLQNKFEGWSKTTGTTIKDLSTLVYLGDALQIYERNHIPLPPNLSAEDAKLIIDTGQWALAEQFKPEPIGKAIGHQLFAMIIQYLQRASAKTETLKYVLLSEHDTSILSMMSILQSAINTPPPSLANLKFELYQAKAGNYYVIIYYNEKAVSIPACHGKICSLEMLTVLLNKTLIPNP